MYKNQEKHLLILYGEIEQENGEMPSLFDRERLTKTLSWEIEQSIEKSIRSIFMPRNEEEIRRYIGALAGQLRYIKQLPQLILMFDEQKEGALYFTVILVRVLLPSSYSIQYLFSQISSFLQFIPDRVKRVGWVRKRYPKEATIFRLSFSSQPFIRDDQSVDLLRARQAAVQELQQVIGPLRDYTGGMLAKQMELLDRLYELMGEKERYIELFFHSIYPAEARSFLPPEPIKNWLVLWKELLEFPEDECRIERDNSYVYVIGHACCIPELDSADYRENQLITARPFYDHPFMGYLFAASDIEEQQSFLSRFPSKASV